MTKAPKKPDSRAKALAGMTKAELVRTVKQLDARQTKLLNEIATLKASAVYSPELLAAAGVVAGRLSPISKELPSTDFGGPKADGNYGAEEQPSTEIQRTTLFPWEQK